MSKNESDEDDYMSDAFLKHCGDSRPGLVPDRVAKQYEREKKKKEKASKHREMFKPRSTLEREKREEGLKETISSDNKGFAMLQKMGYKPGMAIGKKESGRKEPVPIQIKLGRGGFGRETDQKRKQEMRNQMRAKMVVKKQKMESRQRNDFVQRMGGRVAERKTEGDLRKSQKVCEQLDAEAGIKKPSEAFFWPAEFLAKPPKTRCEDTLPEGLSEGYNFVLDDEEDEEEEDEEEEEEQQILYTAMEMLEILTMYLRNTYKYCVWCGTRYEDKADLTSNCPGNTAEDHDD